MITAVTSALAGGAVLVPQILGTLNLSTFGKILSAVAVALFAAAVHRLTTCWRDRQTVVGALCVWPPPSFDAVRLESLGVYPVRGGAGVVAHYQSRTDNEDDDLDAALEGRRPVIVIGPSRCGKSRAIAEAAKRTLAQLPVAIPRNAQMLRAVLDADKGIPTSGPQVCLWLDGLDRFIDALDARALATIREARRPEVKLVASIRAAQWKELLDGTGQPSATARALAGSAELVELGDFVTDDSAVEPAVLTRHPSRKTPPGWSRDGVLYARVGALALTVAFGLLHGQLQSPPSISDQITRLKAEALSEQGPGMNHVVVDERVRLHPAAEPSWLLVVESRRSHDAFDRATETHTRDTSRTLQSDDVRIYDVVRGRLQLKLHFRPNWSGAEAAEWKTLQGGATGAVDYDGDGTPEIIAGYKQPTQYDGALVPFGIEWADNHYELVSLIKKAPKLTTLGLDTAAVALRRALYERPITMSSRVFRARGVSVVVPRLSSPSIRPGTEAFAEIAHRILECGP